MKRSSSQTFPLLKLPNELIYQVVSFISDFAIIRNVLQTSKSMRSFGDPKTQYGKDLWKNVREYRGLPDPAEINLSDFEFLQAYYGRGCNHCDNHPMMRTPNWTFGGLRLCQTCFREATIRDYEMTPPQKTASQLHPYIRVSCYHPYRSRGEYNVYLKSDLELSRSRCTLQDISNFTTKMKKFEDVLSLQKEAAADKMRLERRNVLREILKELFPNMSTNLYSSLQSYNDAHGKTSSFSKAARTRFIKKVTQEIAQNKAYVTKLHVQNLYRDWRYDFFQSKDFRDVCESAFTDDLFPTPSTIIEVLRPVYEEWITCQRHRTEVENRLFRLPRILQKELTSVIGSLDKLSNEEKESLLKQIESRHSQWLEDQKLSLEEQINKAKEKYGDISTRRFHCSCGFYRRQLNTFNAIKTHVEQSHNGVHQICAVSFSPIGKECS